MRHFLIILPILVGLTACGAGAGIAEAPAHGELTLDAIEAERLADEELAMILDLVRALDLLDAMELANEIVFDIVRIDPGDLLSDTADGLFPDPFTFEGIGDGEREDGLPAGAPPSGWGIGGLTSTNATVEKDPETGTVTKTWSWTTTDRHGTETVHTRRETRGPEGRTSSHSTQTNIGGLEVGERRTERADGTREHERWVVDPSTGDGQYSRWSRSPDGDVFHYHAPIVDESVQHTGTPPWRPRPQVRADAPPLWLQDNPGDDDTVWWQQALADWVWRHHRLGRHAPRGTSGSPTRTNPEDPDYDGSVPTGPTVWDYVASGDLVINPDPTGPILASHPPSGRAAYMLREILRSLGQGKTPGGLPGGGGGR